METALKLSEISNRRNIDGECQILFDNDKFAKIEDNLHQQLAINNSNIQILNNLGVLAALRQDFPKAIKYFQECLAISPHYPPAALNYADVLRPLNLFYKALPVLEKLNERYPQDHDIAAYFEECHFRKAMKCFTDYYRKAHRDTPDIEKFRELGKLHLQGVIQQCMLGETLPDIVALDKISMLHWEVLCLLLIFSKYSSGNILEIGPYVGGSTIAMALGKQAAGSAYKIISIEEGGKYLDHPEIPSSDIIGDLQNNLEQFAVRDRVEIIEGYSGEENVLRSLSSIIKKHPNKIGLFFIDADGNIIRDIDSYKDFLAPDCILIVDDYIDNGLHDKGSRTKKAIDELKYQGFITEFGFYGFGTWFGQFNENKFHELDTYRG